jgi:hypothetical protein
MDTYISAGAKSVSGLFWTLTRDTRVFLKEELDLVKTEFFEKVKRMRRNAVILVIGAVVALLGLALLISGLGWLLAYAFSTAGVAPLLAAFVGQGALAVLILFIGTVMIMKSKSLLSSSSLKPEKTLKTLEPITGETASSTKPGKPPTSEELKQHIEKIEGRLGETVHEIGHRLSPHHFNEEVRHRIQAKPYSAGLVAVGAGFISALILTRRPRHV